jgi:peptide/nickel transport system substrate-binding protein
MGNYKVLEAPISEPNVFILGVNLNHPDPVLREIIQDRRFRIALSHAINRKDIRELIYLDQPEESRQVAPKPQSPFYHEAAAKNYIEYDPDKANRLLDEMGLTERNAEGIRLRPDGKPIELVLETRSFRNDFIDALEMIGGWWTDVGIKGTMKAIEGSLFNTRRQTAEFDVSADFAGNGLFPIMRPFDYIPVANNNNFAPLWGQWFATEGRRGEEPPADVKRQLELYEQALVTPDEDERIRLWRQIMDIHAENLYHIGICDRAPVPVPVHNRMRNVPDEGWNCEWVVGNIGVTNPQQYWIAE